jgi:hypothetical protein
MIIALRVLILMTRLAATGVETLSRHGIVIICSNLDKIGIRGKHIATLS